MLVHRICDDVHIKVGKKETSRNARRYYQEENVSRNVGGCLEECLGLSIQSYPVLSIQRTYVLNSDLT